MPLSCSCDYDEYEWYYCAPQDYSQLTGARATRCRSCKTLVKPGAICAVFPRYRYPRSDIEYKIYGEHTEIHLADWVHCETCADLWFSLYELGYECISPDEDVRALVKEYSALHAIGKVEAIAG